MTGEQLKVLENRLWKAADELRANSKLTATEYSFPVLGIIFLRHAHNRFVTAKVEIEKSLPVHPTRGMRPMTKNDFLDAKAIFLPENSRWNTIVDLPDNSDLGEYLNEAMRNIEAEYEDLLGVLPKSYNLFEKELLQRLIRIFNDQALDDMTGDAMFLSHFRAINIELYCFLIKVFKTMLKLA
jgi:type I restriction enzyme M protein